MAETAARAREPTRPGARRRVSKFLTPEVIFGLGMRPEVGSAVRRVGGMRPMFVSDAGVPAAGWVERALPHLAEIGVEWRLSHHLTILERRPDTGVVVLSTFVDEQLVSEALRRGARAHVLKDVDLSELVRVIRAVARRESGFNNCSAAVVRARQRPRSAARRRS